MFNPLHIIFGIDQLLIRIETFLLSSTLIVMLFFASLQVVLRNFFDSGIEWGDVFARHLVLIVGFFGATLSTKEGRHIRIDVLTKIISKKYLPLIEIIILIFCIIVSYLLCSAAYKFMMDEKMAKTVLFSNVPTWYFISIMPIGFGIVTFRYLIQLIEHFMKFGGKKIEEPKHSDLPEIDISVKIKL